MSTQILVTDIERAIEFYTKDLGFDLNFRYGDFYAGIGSGPFSIHLKLVCETETCRMSGDNVDMVIGVTDLEACYAAMQNSRAKVVQPLRTMPYGREFYIEDPDGNRLAFYDVTS
ncbi:MAG: VOC family protein [Verrucomicrobiota bacterium]